MPGVSRMLFAINRQVDLVEQLKKQKKVDDFRRILKSVIDRLKNRCNIIPGKIIFPEISG
jgi:hypothetical protein